MHRVTTSGPERAPRIAALTIFLGYLLYLTERTIVVAKGNISSLALIGTSFANRRQLPSYLYQHHGNGYDGQFFLRLALDPFNLSMHAFGITMNGAFRDQRIVYPFLAWVLALGHDHWVPFTLVIVNLIAVTVVAYMGAKLARDTAHPAMVGLLLGGYFGYTMSTGRDLTEPTAAAFLLIAMYLFEGDHPVFAGISFALAGLAIETELIVPIAIGAIWLVVLLYRRRSTFNPLVFIIPGLAALGFQGLLRIILGRVALSGDIRGNIGVPIYSMLVGIADHTHKLNLTNLIWFGQLVIITLFVVLAALNLKSPDVPLYLKVAWGMMLILTLSLSGEIWDHSSYFRATDILWLTSVLVWSRSRPAQWWPAYLGYIATFVSVTPLLVFF
ncbi:hypothetical protein [Ferrimicrobium sp.]|uniref:hypothetical protein n=1 Tax=Ferrimicrobium sp. TaxID=2926050 RepID=UPI0026271B47|nr:hypothetical protein [Ferrimicrobium sp.]